MKLQRKPQLLEATWLSKANLPTFNKMLAAAGKVGVIRESPLALVTHPRGEKETFLECEVEIDGVPQVLKHGDLIIRHDDGRLEVVDPNTFDDMYIVVEDVDTIVTRAVEKVDIQTDVAVVEEHPNQHFSRR